MLPHAQGFPAQDDEVAIHSPIAGTVHLDLVCPEATVVAGRDVMFRASMPEAAIDKNGHSRPREDNVWSSR
jgi:hypothetical protein